MTTIWLVDLPNGTVVEATARIDDWAWNVVASKSGALVADHLPANKYFLSRQEAVHELRRRHAARLESLRKQLRKYEEMILA